MAFHVGQKVVCVDDSFFDPDIPHPLRGDICTVRWVGMRPTDGGGIGLMFDEVSPGLEPVSQIEWCFAAHRFRPVVERKTDISVFTAMLTPNRVNA